MSRALISADDLFKSLPSVKILDCTYNMPDIPVRIGGARDFDIDAVADTAAVLPHTIPSAARFGEMVGLMGISNNDTVVVYDRAGMHMAASRVWWMFRLFGHDNVRVLDGGLPAWMERGYPLSPPRADTPAPAHFAATFRPELFKTRNDMLGNLEEKSFGVIDARDAARFQGAAPEPRPGMAAGHIPGSLNLPFASLIDGDTGRMKPPAALADLIVQSGFDPKKPAAISCGSGVTACVVALALYETGYDTAAIYGGSWSEWGSDPALPKATGEK